MRDRFMPVCSFKVSLGFVRLLVTQAEWKHDAAHYFYISAHEILLFILIYRLQARLHCCPCNCINQYFWRGLRWCLWHGSHAIAALINPNRILICNSLRPIRGRRLNQIQSPVAQCVHGSLPNWKCFASVIGHPSLNRYCFCNLCLENPKM